MHLGHCREADIPRILEVRLAAFSRQTPPAYSADEARTLLADVDEAELQDMTAGQQLFVARAARQVMGVAGWRQVRLRHVYIDPAHTRQGIATELVGRAEWDFQQQTSATQILLPGVALHAEGVLPAARPRLHLQGHHRTGVQVHHGPEAIRQVTDHITSAAVIAIDRPQQRPSPTKPQHCPRIVRTVRVCDDPPRCRPHVCGDQSAGSDRADVAHAAGVTRAAHA